MTIIPNKEPGTVHTVFHVSEQHHPTFFLICHHFATGRQKHGEPIFTTISVLILTFTPACIRVKKQLLHSLRRPF